jgi:NAD(P)-dependent dehydrogenase (short-subunit alcohol dehydrogenase family)
MKTVLITGIRNEFDKKLAGVFGGDLLEKDLTRGHGDTGEEEGFRVFVLGRELPDDLKGAAAELEKGGEHIDIYIDVSDERSGDDTFNVRSGVNEKVIRKLYEANVIRPMALLEAFMPFLEKGQGKRLCFLTSAEASINETRGTDGLGYKMAKAALANFLQITRNVLAPKGYTIRAFDPLSAEVTAQAAAEAAFNYFTRRRGMERDDSNRDDEGNLVFRDALGRQHAW